MSSPTIAVCKDRFIWIDGVKLGRLVEPGFIELLAPRSSHRQKSRRKIVIGPTDLLKLAIFCMEPEKGGGISEEL